MEPLLMLLQKLAALSSQGQTGDIALPNESGRVDPRLPQSTKTAESFNQGLNILRNKHLIKGTR